MDPVLVSANPHSSIRFRILALFCVVTWTFICIPQPGFAQGNLNPPGAPAATFKTLSQIEPRIPIEVVPTNITISGSYYLVTNLTGIVGTNGITISVDNVTLDLNGFTLIGVPGSSNGSAGNLLVRNSSAANSVADSITGTQTAGPNVDSSNIG